MVEFKRLRRTIAAEAVSSDALALLLASCELAVYGGLLALFCVTTDPLRWVALFAAGIAAGALFLIGHDASHQALARSARLNTCIAHITFMPTLHPQIAWIVGHNRRHHAFTNLRGVDYVWTPWSPAQYREATRFARARYRFYRSPVGVPLYYAFEIWLHHMWSRDELDRQYATRAHVVADRAITLGGFLAIAATCFALSIAHGANAPAALTTAALAVVVPFAIFSALMSVTIFVHHTHPRIRWFQTQETYDPLVAQMQSTVHIGLPKAVELLFHDIFQHTAHHLNPRVPLYRLARAQRTLEAADGPPIVRERFSLRYVGFLLRTCQLYDYDADRWLTVRDVTGDAQT